VIKKKSDKWLTRCELCSWSKKAVTEREARQSLTRHMDIVHKKPLSSITEQRSPVPDDEKVGLPEAQKPQGVTKEGSR
jgi:hypothetical protein